MPAILMTQEQIQSLIAHNKARITYLESKRKLLKEAICTFWKDSDPMKTSLDSQTAFKCLNMAKDELRKVRKQIKILADLQSSLKYNKF